MIVGGLLIVAGLFFSSSKAQAYTAWCQHKVDSIDQITISKPRRATKRATPEHQHEQQEAGVEGDVCEV